MTEVLQMWTVYDHPTDCPEFYVARLFEVDAAGPKPTMDTMHSENLDTLRASLSLLGLTPLARMPGDHPKIIEVWL